jgi:hypothetical protein
MKQVEELKKKKRDLDEIKNLGTAAVTEIVSTADKKQARKDFLTKEKKDLDAVLIRMQQQLLKLLHY